MRRWRWLVPLMVLGVALAGLSAWAALDALRIQRELDSARRAVTGVAGQQAALAQPARRPPAVRALREAATDADGAAARARSSFPLRALSIVPALGAQRDGVRRLGEDVADVARDVATLVEEADRVAVAARAGADVGLVPVDHTEALRAAAANAARTMRRTTRGESSLYGPVADARRRYDAIATDNARTLQDAADALGAARTFAGGDGARRYLVLGQNNAEMRDSGMVLSYAVVRVEQGRFAVERRGSVDDLKLTRPAPVEPPAQPGTEALFQTLEPTRLWQSVNATADWPWTCRASLAMYAQATGERLDGVLALDVVGLVEVLRLTGPVTAAGIPQRVSATNAADLLLRDLYATVPAGADQGPRRDAVAGVATAVVDALGARRPDPVRLGRALATAAAGGHLRVCSTDPAEQEVFARLGPGDGPDGPTDDTAARTFHYAVQNANGTKLDYHLATTVTFDVTTTPAGTAVVRTTVAAANAAPPDAAPSYALGPNLGLTHAPGHYDGRVYLWGPRGSSQQGSVEDAGLRASQSVIAVPPGADAAVRFETVLRGAVRDGRLALRLVPQSRLRPARLEVRIDGRTVHSGRWRTTVDRSWPISGDGA